MMIIRFYKLLFFLCVIVYIFSPTLLLSEECHYNLSAIDKSFFLKHTKFSDAIWDNKRKEAKIIFENNDELIVQYSGCEHFGMEAKYALINSNFSSNLLKNKIKWLASKLLRESEFKLLTKAVDGEQFNQDIKNFPNIPLNETIFLSIHDSVYIEFLVAIIKLDKSKYSINISWYY